MPNVGIYWDPIYFVPKNLMSRTMEKVFRRHRSPVVFLINQSYFVSGNVFSMEGSKPAIMPPTPAVWHVVYQIQP